MAQVPTLAMPHFLLAQLSFAAGDTQTATAEAALGKQYYHHDLETARHAFGYYQSVQDWNNAKFFLSEVVSYHPLTSALPDVASIYDLAKVTYLTGDKAGADAIVVRLRVTHPEVLPTDPNFLAAITAYEQSQK
jgi:hypothetical protein